MEKEQGPSFFCSTRFGLAVIGFLGCVVIYAQRVDLSVALVCMVKKPNPNATDLNSTFTNISEITGETREGEFEWSKEAQGYVLGAFFWGYLMTQVLGGWAAQRYGARIVMGGTVLLGSVLTLLTPLVSRLHIAGLITLRVILGFAQGATFPGFHTLWGHWAPPLERSKLTGVTYAGAQIGNVIALPISGVLCDYGFAGGWPSIFYVLGAVGLLWVVLWFLCVSDTPKKNMKMSANERSYIVESLHNQVIGEHRKVPVPWKAVFTSMPVWAVIVGHFSADWGAYIMLTCLPSFMKDVLDFDMTKLGLTASIPYIAYFAVINIAGFLADFIRSRGILSTGNTRKAAMTIALGSQAVFLLAASYCGKEQETLVVVLLTLGIGLSGFCYAGFIVNYMDIAPAFAGTVLGIGNTLSCLCGILSPIAMGVLTKNKRPEEWTVLFYLTFVILIAGAIFFDIFASGEVQAWAVLPDETEEEMQKMKPKKALKVPINDIDDATDAKSPLV